MLPLGWEARQDQWGRTYYTDHNTETTHWQLPSPTSPSAVTITINPASSSPNANNTTSNTVVTTATTTAPAAPVDARYDWSVLTPERMQAYATKQWTEKDVDYDCCGCLSATGSTICDNTLMCCFVIIFWAFIGLFIAGVAAESDVIVTYTAPGIVLAVVSYVFYFIAVIMPVLDCCGKRAGSTLSDLPRAAYAADVLFSFQNVTPHMTSLAEAQPELTLHVECYHMRKMGTLRHKVFKKTVSYRDSTVIPLRAWRDVSPRPKDVSNRIFDTGASYCAINYDMKYTLASEQKPLLDVMAADYEKLHRSKDKMIRTWYTYSSPAHDEKRVDHVAKPRSMRYVLSRLLMNPFSFYFLLFFALYPVYIVGWKVFEKSYTVTNHKLLYLDHATLTVRDQNANKKRALDV